MYVKIKNSIKCKVKVDLLFFQTIKVSDTFRLQWYESVQIYLYDNDGDDRLHRSDWSVQKCYFLLVYFRI